MYSLLSNIQYIVLREWILFLRTVLILKEVISLFQIFFVENGCLLLTIHGTQLKTREDPRNVNFLNFIIDWFIFMNNIACLKRNSGPKGQREWRVCWGITHLKCMKMYKINLWLDWRNIFSCVCWWLCIKYIRVKWTTHCNQLHLYEIEFYS